MIRVFQREDDKVHKNLRLGEVEAKIGTGNHIVGAGNVLSSTETHDHVRLTLQDNPLHFDRTGRYH